jgi:hypothetical protein
MAAVIRRGLGASKKDYNTLLITMVSADNGRILRTLGSALPAVKLKT